MKESKYRNVDSIPTGLNNSQWSSTTSGAYAIYNNDPMNDGIYGKLYNHYAVTDTRGLCPTGWHVPSDGEWTTLESHLGGASVAGGPLKSTATQPTTGGWFHPNTGATNSSGFTAQPGGIRRTIGDFYYLAYGAFFWTSTTNYGSFAWYNKLWYQTEICDGRGDNSQQDGFSVRCLKNTLPQINTSSVTGVTHFSAFVTGEVISEGDQNTTRGFCYSTTPNTTISNDTTMNGTGIGVYSDTLQNLTPLTTYYVRAYATNSVGTSYGNEVSFTTDSLPGVRCPGTPTVTDIDGNTYYTVQIGNQCWTQSNLKVSKYRNGDNIPTGLSNSDWSNTTSGAYAIYNNDPVNDGLFGKLYNHYAVTDSRGLCPTGWHVPSDGDWTTLENQLGGASVAGGALKSTATQPTPGGWNPQNTGVTNSSGFSALAGGNRSGPDGTYGAIYNNGIFGTSSESSFNNYWTRNLYYLHVDVARNINTLRGGTTIRCLKNTLPQVNTTSVTNVTPLTAMVTGEVISVGDQNTIRGFCYSTASNPTISDDTTMNGTGTGVYSDTLLNLTPSTTYYVRAYATNSAGTSYGNELYFTSALTTIGSSFAGGIVFYIDSTGQHGLVCAPNDQGQYLGGCLGGNYVGTSTALGTGIANTGIYANGCTPHPELKAADICWNLVLNGYNDWFLPSRDELSLMYQNLRTQNLGNFGGAGSGRYWSSSQNGCCTNWGSSAWGVDFNNGNIVDCPYYIYVNNRWSSQQNSVRAVRSF